MKLYVKIEKIARPMLGWVLIGMDIFLTLSTINDQFNWQDVL